MTAEAQNDPYEILGVPSSASFDDVQKAYRRLASALHPDLNPDDPSANPRFQKVNWAYDLLRNPEGRKEWDEKHEQPKRAATMDCPLCTRSFTLPPSLLGSLFACPHCGGQLMMPGTQRAAPPPPPPPPPPQPSFHFRQAPKPSIPRRRTNGLTWGKVFTVLALIGIGARVCLWLTKSPPQTHNVDSAKRAEAATDDSSAAQGKPKVKYKFADEPFESTDETQAKPSPPTDWNNSIGMKLVLIPAGEYLRGNELSVDQLVSKYPGTNQAWFSANSPQHRVVISRDFYLAAFEVTVSHRRFVLKLSQWSSGCIGIDVYCRITWVRLHTAQAARKG